MVELSWPGYFWNVNLIHCLDVYLVLIFVLGTALRIRQYRDLLGLIWSRNDRWPHLVKLVKQHRGIFFTWGTILPALLAFILSLGHVLACRLVWPQADITIADLVERRLALLMVGFLAAAMIGLDCYSAFQVRKWDRDQVEKKLDRAEHWLQSWTAPVVRVFTLGFIHPRKLVGIEVAKALEAVSQQLNSSLWRTSLQVSLRIAFGGSLWLLWIPVHR